MKKFKKAMWARVDGSGLLLRYAVGGGPKVFTSFKAASQFKTETERVVRVLVVIEAIEDSK